MPNTEVSKPHSARTTCTLNHVKTKDHTILGVSSGKEADGPNLLGASTPSNAPSSFNSTPPDGVSPTTLFPMILLGDFNHEATANNGSPPDVKKNESDSTTLAASLSASSSLSGHDTPHSPNRASSVLSNEVSRSDMTGDEAGSTSVLGAITSGNRSVIKRALNLAKASSVAFPTHVQVETCNTPAQPPPMETIFKGLSPPSIKEHACRNIARNHFIEWEDLNNHEKKVLAFMFDREVHTLLFLHQCDLQSKEDQEHASWDVVESYKKIYKEVAKILLEMTDPKTTMGKEAATIVLERGITFMDTVPDTVFDIDVFNHEVGHKCWSTDLPNDAVNLLRTDLTKFNYVQHGPKCCFYAAGAMYRYLCEWHEVSHDRQLLDVPRFMRTLSAAEIVALVVRGEGGHSTTQLEKILHDSSLCRCASAEPIRPGKKMRNDDELANLVLEKLRNHGPVLVSNVLLSKDFEKSGSSVKGSKCDFPPANTKERHAMVLLGMRKDEAGVWWWFLQNWWENMQFVEVDMDWIRKSRSEFYFHNAMRGSLNEKDLPHYLLHQGKTVYAEASPCV